MCGRLNVSMYGTRDAAFNWHEHYKQHLIGLGFKQHTTPPCSVASGVDAKLTRFAAQMRKHPKCKIQIVGPETKDDKHVKVLNRIITWQEKDGHQMMTYEADPRHAEIIKSEMGVNQAKTLATITIKGDVGEETNSELTKGHETACRSVHTICVQRNQFSNGITKGN